MYSMKIKAAAASLVLMIASLATAANPTAPAKDKDGPDLPSPLCDHLRVEAGNKLHSQVYATGVQIYRWDGNSWVLVGPDATLFANAGHDGKVGKHYVGPTWESNSGSKVVGSRMYGCSPDPTAIPWLLLEASVVGDGPTGGDKLLATRRIQRVHTVEGKAPANGCAQPGDIGKRALVPYEADYYFYKDKRTRITD